MPVPLRPDFDAVALRLLAKRSKDGVQARRLLALAAIHDGASRAAAASIGGVTVPAANASSFGAIVRNWVVSFNTHGPVGLIDRKPPGQPSRRSNAHRAALVQAIEDGPTPAVHGVVRWRLIDLCQWLWETFRVRIAKPTLSREVRALGYRKFSARPRHHAQAAGAVEAFEETSARTWRRSRASSAST